MYLIHLIHVMPVYLCYSFLFSVHTIPFTFPLILIIPKLSVTLPAVVIFPLLTYLYILSTLYFHPITISFTPTSSPVFFLFSFPPPLQYSYQIIYHY